MTLPHEPSPLSLDEADWPRVAPPIDFAERTAALLLAEPRPARAGFEGTSRARTTLRVFLAVAFVASATWAAFEWTESAPEPRVAPVAPSLAPPVPPIAPRAAPRIAPPDPVPVPASPPVRRAPRPTPVVSAPESPPPPPRVPPPRCDCGPGAVVCSCGE